MKKREKLWLITVIIINMISTSFVDICFKQEIKYIQNLIISVTIPVLMFLLYKWAIWTLNQNK